MVDTRFKPGQSGNPGGRTAIPEELKVRLLNLSTKAVDTLEQALCSPDGRVQITAAMALLDRTYGKPAQQSDVTMTTIDAGALLLAALNRQARLRALEPLDITPPKMT